ncbi:hydrogenase small subunit [Sulfurospirillum sp. T05]|uniref:Hydrogenase small subunit n=1 Tax=Sulfurospirillum tamanense TaxID=2813362 RepID=A0ABS2WS14_9BACT|nr:hydrogenase small subunit [Sulfurospirillum tamanensis]MBN2964163.1 hydrogenase small subunit [Sulfurospirillum tamanensis]
MEHAEMFERVSARLAELSKFPKLREDKSVRSMMDENGVNRRDFMKWAAGMTALLSLPSSFTPLMAQAAELTDRLPVVWLHMAECTGCSESLVRTAEPTIDSLLFDFISLEYHETLMAAAGWQAEHNLEDAIKKYKGRLILMVEGGIPEGQSEFYLTVGPHGTTGAAHCRAAAESAAAIFAIGSCSSFGGVQAAYPNPTNAQPMSKFTNKTVINVPGCPPSEKNIVGQVLHYVLFGALPALDVYNRPKWSYGIRIHDLCERRGRFDAGEFVEQFGDEGAKKGYCLYKVGCKGPYTFNNCSIERFNQHTSWPIQAGHGCIGCSEPDFWDTMGPFEEPLGSRLYQTLYGVGADKTADKVGVALLTATAVGIAAHAAIAAVKGSKKEEE